MNRFAIALLAGVAGVSLVSAASAADLIIEQPAAPIVGVVDAGGNWDGLYLGGFVGYAGGELDSDLTEIDALDLNGWQIGAAVGANFTVTDGIVAGIVADIAWADVASDEDVFTSDWNGSLRGRLGFDGGAFLPYLTAGLAVAGGDFDGESNTHLGWTAGAGVEFAVTDSMSLDLLYRYSDYESKDYAGADIGFDSHAVTVGVNFKF